MKVLLDTHVFLWWINEHERLSNLARRILESADTEAYVSVAVVWEITIKARLGRFNLPEDLKSFLRQQIITNRFQVLPINLDHTLAVFDLPVIAGHREPFDRLLISQSTVEEMPVISGDLAFEAYEVERLW